MAKTAKPIFHGRDHAPDGPDPIPGLVLDGDGGGGDFTLRAIRGAVPEFGPEYPFPVDPDGGEDPVYTLTYEEPNEYTIYFTTPFASLPVVLVTAVNAGGSSDSCWFAQLTDRSESYIKVETFDLSGDPQYGVFDFLAVGPP